MIAIDAGVHLLGGDPRAFYALDKGRQLDVLAYHALATDRKFEGRFGLLQPMTLGGYEMFDALKTGRLKIGAAAREGMGRVKARLMKKTSNSKEDIEFFFGGSNG